jgi:hypothetical protein
MSQIKKPRKISLPSRYYLEENYTNKLGRHYDLKHRSRNKIIYKISKSEILRIGRPAILSLLIGTFSIPQPVAELVLNILDSSG